MRKLASDEQLMEALNKGHSSSKEIQTYLKAIYNIDIKEPTIRGRFIQMKQPLSSTTIAVAPQPVSTITPNQFMKGKRYQPYATGQNQSAPSPSQSAPAPSPAPTQPEKKPQPTAAFAPNTRVYVVSDIATVDATVEPGINGWMKSLADQELTVDYIDNHGFVKVKENQARWHSSWLTATPPTPPPPVYAIPDELKQYIPGKEKFAGYVERDVDKRLALHYSLGKHPISQGKQGCGKTMSHMYYAHKEGLPFFLFSCYEDFKLQKLFGDKTIKNGTITFQESEFVKAIQSPSVILFDEINAVSQANTYDFHALLQNRQLYIKDANDGNGKLFILHPECKIGFAQNPKSAKYIGGNVRSSNFLGRCTYLTYPEFAKKEINELLRLKYPKVSSDERAQFLTYFTAVLKVIEENDVNVDISIRQLTNVIDLWASGMELKYAVQEGLSNIVDAISQPKIKEAFDVVAAANWKELIKK